MAPPTRQEAVPPNPKEVSRRDAIKRIAVAGGALWTLPAIQTVHMERAYAMGGSPTRKCYSVYIDKHYGCNEAPDLDPNVFKCLHGKIEQTRGGCQLLGVSFNPDGTGRWFVTLSPGTRFVAGFSRIAGKCIPSPTPAGAAGIIEFDPGPGGGTKNAIQHVEMTFCRQTGSQNASVSGTGPTGIGPGSPPSASPSP
jgi:hypothetical protein